jgi:hypothetical protein
MKEDLSVMPFARARVALLPAPDDPPIVSGWYQAVFGKFRRFLLIRGVEASTPMFYNDVEAAAEGYVGEFIVPLSQAIRPPLATVLSAWLEGRPGRAVRLNVGERQVEARSTEEAESFLRRAQRLLAKPLEYGEPRP